MPTAPFGLAYGLGAGMAIAPQQMFNRQQQANQLAMQGLQQQLLQHQVAQQQAEEQAFSQPVAPQTETVPTYGTETEQMPAAMTPEGKPFEEAGTIPIQRQVQTGTETRAVQHVTPYQKMAYELGQRADKLASMGFGRSAMALQQQAAQMYGQHMDVARGMAIQSMLRGDKSGAVNALNSIGIQASDVGKFDTPDGEMFYIQDPSGQNTLLSREDLAAVAADPSKVADVMQRQAQYGMLYGSRMAGYASRERIATAGREATASQKELDRQNRLEIANIRASRPDGLAGSATTADERRVSALVRDTGMSLQEAWDRVKPDIQSRGAITDKDRLHNLQKENSDLIRVLGHIPEKDEPEYEAYMANKEAISGLSKARTARPTAPAPGAPKQNYEGEISPSGAYKFSGGQWVPNK